jgi:hypothetical protein
MVCEGRKKKRRADQEKKKKKSASETQAENDNPQPTTRTGGHLARYRVCHDNKHDGAQR